MKIYNLNKEMYCCLFLNKKNIFLFLFLLICFFIPQINIVESQLMDTDDPDRGRTTISVSPQAPKPYSEIDVQIYSYAFDLNMANVKWFVNGMLYEEGVGKKLIKVKLGPAGKVFNINVLIFPSGKEPVELGTSINPANIDLLWEAKTYVPVFYKGKSLFSEENEIVVWAYPTFLDASGKRISEDSLVYKWSLNDNLLNMKSGLGKSSVNIVTTFTSSNPKVSVVVSSPGLALLAENTINIKPTQPNIVFYEDHPLYGIIKSKAIVDEIRLRTEEITIKAEPYFFCLPSNEYDDSLINYTWRLNNNRVPQTQKKDSITLRQEEGQKGSSYISLEIKNTEKVVFPINESFRIIFGQ